MFPMQFFKKEGTSHFSNYGIDELKQLYLTYSYFEKAEHADELLSSLKKVLCRLILIDDNFTFEEIIEQVTGFADVCRLHYLKIQELQKKKDMLLAKNKHNTKNKKIMTELKYLKEEVDSENEIYKLCMQRSQAFTRGQIKTDLITLCKNLSTVQFSDHEISHPELKELMFDCLWIVHLVDSFMEMPKSVSTEMEQLLNTARHEENKHAHVHLDDLNAEFTHVLRETERAISEERKNEARELYSRTISLYGKLEDQGRAKHHKSIFRLWFELYFNDY